MCRIDSESPLSKAIELVNQNISYLNTHPKRKNIEEQTKQSLILPLLSALGYDIFSPDCLHMEEQSVLNPNEHVDYVVHADGGHKFYVEAKHLGYNLDATYQQLNKYFQGDTTTKIAIVTDGNEYRFYTDIRNKNILDSEPYYVVRMDDLSSDDITFIGSFSNGQFSETKQQKFALKCCIYNFANDIQRSDLLTCGFRQIVDEMEIESSYLFDYGIDKADEVSLCYEDKVLYRKQMFDILSHPTSSNISVTSNEAPSVSDAEDVDAEISPSMKSSPKSKRDLNNVPSDIIFLFTNKNNDWYGQMKVINGKCVVLSGSKLSSQVKEYSDGGKSSERIASIRKDMSEFISHAENGSLTLLIDTDGLNSPSRAGGFVNGGSANGWTCWKDENGKTLEEYALAEEQ